MLFGPHYCTIPCIKNAAIEGSIKGLFWVELEDWYLVLSEWSKPFFTNIPDKK